MTGRLGAAGSRAYGFGLDTEVESRMSFYRSLFLGYGKTGIGEIINYVEVE